MTNFKLLDHPALLHSLTILRDKNTSVREFRIILKEMSRLLIFEATRDLKLTTVEKETPLEKDSFPWVQDDVLLISVMRAGNAFLEGALEALPFALGGHIGLKRLGNGHSVEEYYYNVPTFNDNSQIFLLDPMVATGGSIIHTIDKVKERGMKNLHFVSLLMSPYAKERLAKEHPDVKVFTTAVDREMNEKNYILPGLGDAGDRIYGTS